MDHEAFGDLLKMEYALSGGDKVVIEAFVAFFGAAEGECFITGSEPSAFKCRAENFSRASISSAEAHARSDLTLLMWFLAAPV